MTESLKISEKLNFTKKERKKKENSLITYTHEESHIHSGIAYEQNPFFLTNKPPENNQCIVTQKLMLQKLHKAITTVTNITPDQSIGASQYAYALF